MLGTVPGRGVRGVEGSTPNIWKTHGVAKVSFYKARAWEVANPGKRWSEDNIRLRGKVALLTHAMENELNHWVAISQLTSGGVELDNVCRVAFALMASDPDHYTRVKHYHKEYEAASKKALSRDWFFTYRKKYPDLLRCHRSEGYAVGRAQVFLRLIHRAWINACQPQIFTNGWAKMGLNACSMMPRQRQKMIAKTLQ